MGRNRGYTHLASRTALEASQTREVQELGILDVSYKYWVESRLSEVRVLIMHVLRNPGPWKALQNQV
jgi:hypothetical protein